MKNCSVNTLDKQECIRPDSLTGMIFAIEGIRNAMVMLNGPMGCKFYHSTTSQFLSLRPMLYLPLQGEDGTRKVPVDYNYLNDFFFRQPRVPCTALDGYDYVYGTSEKVAEALHYIHDQVEFDLLAVVNSPGASLIGDNLKELVDEILPDRICIVLESPGYSLEFDSGYADASLELLKQCKGLIRERQKQEKKKVNLLGLSIWERYLEGDREEWKRLLGLCGIEVNCCLCAENTMEEMKNILQADLNVVIDPARALETAKYLKAEYGQEYYSCDLLPVGFASTEKIITDICRLLDRDMTAFRRDSERTRAVCFSKINDIYHMCGLPKGAAFAVVGSEAQEKAFSEFFTEYMGMTKTKKEEAELVFADGNTIAQLKLLERGGHSFCGIEINLPGMGYTDVYPKTQMGIRGAAFLTEQVLNGLMTKI